MLILTGVTLRTSLPSTETFAPEGYEVTLNTPCESSSSARRAAGTPSKNRAATRAIGLHTRLRVGIPLLLSLRRGLSAWIRSMSQRGRWSLHHYLLSYALRIS